jgi:hypothetical protein
MSATGSTLFLPRFGHALRRALQWRLLLLWVLVTLIPASVVALPFGRIIFGQLDHSVHAGEWAQRFNIVMFADLMASIKTQSAALAGAEVGATVLLLLLIPFLNGLFVVSARAVAPLKMGDLIRGGLQQYGPMLRLSFMAVVPLGIALALGWAAMKGVGRYTEHAILETNVDHLKWAALGLSAVLFALADATVDAGRASLALSPGKRSAIKAWWRGLKLVLTHPLRSLVLFLGVTALAAVSVLAVNGVQAALHAATPSGFVWVFITTQVIVAIMAWMHFARLFAMLELTRTFGPVVVKA